VRGKRFTFAEATVKGLRDETVSGELKIIGKKTIGNRSFK
jgi:hypothetical protein